MQNHKTLVRLASIDDSNDILRWRNDEHSRKMFFDTRIVSANDHNSWFTAALENPDREMFIGEIDGFKIGVCRFDFDKKGSFSEVSINMNPKARGKGFAKEFLKNAIEEYLKKNNRDLIAKVKIENSASQKIFADTGFELVKTSTNKVLFKKAQQKLSFKRVSEADTDILYELLNKRKHSISHKKMPSYSDHQRFVRSNPYLHWYLISREQPIGLFYIQSNNSVGLNISDPTEVVVNEVLNFIRKNFEPVEGEPSKTPPYFYINVAHPNSEMKEILEQLQLKPIQVSYQLP